MALPTPRLIVWSCLALRLFVQDAVSWKLRLVTVITDSNTPEGIAVGTSMDVPLWHMVGAWSPAPLTILGDGFRYHEGLKAHLYFQYLSSLSQEDLQNTMFLLLDAHDVVFNGANLSVDAVIRRYFRVAGLPMNTSHATELPVILAAEANCWVGSRSRGVEVNEANKFVWSAGHCTADEERQLSASDIHLSEEGHAQLRYPNSGALLGPGFQILRVFTAANHVVFSDDQFLLGQAMLKTRTNSALTHIGADKSSPLVVLDRQEILFGSLLELVDCQDDIRDESLVRSLTCGPPPFVRTCCARAVLSNEWKHSFIMKRRGGRCALVRQSRTRHAAPLVWHGHGPGKALINTLAGALLQCSAEHSGWLEIRKQSFTSEYWPFRLTCSTLNCPKIVEHRLIRSRQPMWRSQAS